MNKNYLVKTFLNLYNNEGSYYRRPEAKISEANRKTLKVETSAGSISGSEQTPVSNVIEPKVEVKGDTATAKLDVNVVNKVITEAAKAGEKKIIIEPQGTKDAKGINVSIPKASAEMLAAQKDMSVSVETKSGQVNIPADAMASIVKEAKGSDISVTIALKEKSEVKDAAASKLMENILKSKSAEKKAS